MYVEGIVRVRHVRKLCTDFQKSWADIHNDRTVRPKMPSSDMKATRTEGLILGRWSYTLESRRFYNYEEVEMMIREGLKIQKREL